MKSKGTAYLLWFFLGWAGAHKFYLNKTVIGILYLFTLGFGGIGLLIDLFTLGNQVDLYNATHNSKVSQGQQQSQNIVVNVSSPVANTSQPQVSILSAEKQILALASKQPVLTVNQIMNGTTIELEEIEMCLKKLTTKGLVKELVDTNGKVKYDFS